MKLRIFILTIFGYLITASAVNHISNNFKKSIVEIEQNQLLSVSQALSSHVETYFQELENTTHTLANSLKTSSALISFANSYDYFNHLNVSPAKYLRENYIEKNPFKEKESYRMAGIKGGETPYDLIHKKFHDYFSKEQELHGFYDTFLIDKRGNVVYSVDKESDFGTNLINGPYANTGLAKVYQKAAKLNFQKIAFEDFKPYPPSNNKPSAFLALPVFQNNDLIGVFAVQIPVEKINKIMSFNGKLKESGMGETGEAYMVGEDLLMRSNSRFFTNNSIGVVKVDTLATKKGLSGSGFMQIKDYRGVDVYSSYTPINVFGHRWVVLAEIDKQEVLEKIQDNIFYFFIESLAIMLTIVFVSIRIVNKYLVAPLESNNRKLQNSIKAKDEQLLISETVSDEYKQAFDLVAIVSKTNSKGIITYANANFCELTGYSEDELVGNSHNMLSHPDTPKELYNDLWETISSKRIWKGEMTDINKNKEVYTVDLTIIPILEKNGDIREFMSIVYKL